MTFASYVFLLGFFPAALAGCYAIARRRGPRAAAAWLVAASLLFCAWGSPTSAGILVVSSAASFALSRSLARCEPGSARGSALLWAGICGHIALLGYFKYAGFFAENANLLLGTGFRVAARALPLGISFFTFQQIAYLVDARRGDTRGDRGLDYALFVSFFPKLIAGPLADSRALLPQFSRPDFGRFSDQNLAVGLTLLAAGLFKKVIVANELGERVDPLFAAAGQAGGLPFEQAWVAALAYALQLYFDFSGYSDMALGAARCVGIVLPLNFYSPYRSTSIVEFWRRWHITLSRFLMRYLYTPIATPLTRWALQRGLRPLALFGATVAVPTVATFAIAGLWHGAAWTWVVFGLLQGLYLTANQGWRELRRHLFGRPAPSRLRALGSWALTFAAVLVSFVFVRASSIGEAWSVVRALAGTNGWNELGLQAARPLLEPRDWMLIAGTAAVALLAPNVEQLLRPFEPALGMPKEERPPRWRWQPRPAFALLSVLLFVISLAALGGSNPFIYYRF